MLDDAGSPFRSVRYAEPSRLSAVPRVLAVLAVLVVLALVGGVVGLWVVANGRIEPTAVSGLVPTDGEVVNLLVASAADGTAAVDGVAVVQLAASRQRPAALVLPAALEVDVPDTGTVTLGQAPEVGGMALLVEEVARYTGLDLHHYVRVDRSALAAIVDTSGGLDDCPAPDVDPCPRLIGDDVRTRLDAADDAVTGPQRVRAHLDVATIVAAEVARPRTLLDARRALRWATAWDEVLTTDVDPGVRGARALAEQLAGVDAERLDVRILPGLVDDGRITVEPESSAVLLEAFTKVTQLPADVGLDAPRELEPADVTVQVLNGVGRAGVAAEMADFLTERGFVVGDVDNALRFDQRAPTAVRHRPEGAAKAALVVAFLPDAELEEATDLPDGVDLVVVVGAGGAP